MLRSDFSGTRLGDIRVPWLPPLLIGLSVVVAAWVLYLTSYRNFFFDEWGFIESRIPWHLDLLLLPHRDHWSTIPVLVWKLLFITVGLRSHVPYEAALLVVHVAAVFLLFVLIRRHSGDLPAFGAALILLVLGSGADGIVWAFQIGWAGSVAFGLLAMLLLDGDPPFPRRLLPASASILCSLMCSSVGLAFLVAVGVEVLADRRRRRFVLALVVPTAAFLVWFLTLDTGRVAGFTGISGDLFQGATSWGYVANVVRFVAIGFAASSAGVVGLEGVVGVALALFLAFLVTLDMQRGLEAWQIGMLAGILFFFTLVATGRVQYGVNLAAESRYVYVGVVFLLPLVAHALGRISWRGLWRPAVLATFAVCLFGNVVRLHDAALNQIDFMRTEVAELQTVEVFRGAPDIALGHYIDNTVISSMHTDTYLSAIDQLGSPVPPATTATLSTLPSFAVDRVMLNLFGDALTLKADGSKSGLGLLCRTVDSPASSAMDFRVPNGESIMLRSSTGGDALLFLGFEAPPVSQPLRKVQLMPATEEWVHVPDTGKPVMWQLRISTGAVGLIQVCAPSGVMLP